MQPAEIQSISESMARRAPQWRSRLVIGAIVAAVSFPLTSPAFAAGWFAVYAALQLTERKLNPDGPLAQRLAPGRYVLACLALAFLNNLVFSAYGAAEMLSGTMLGLTCGMMVIGGVVVNAVMMSPGSRTMVAVALAPQAFYLLLLPYAALRLGLSTFAVAQLTFAAVMLILAGLSIRTQISRLFAQMQAARAQADQANAAKSQFLATMSHEVRTPLNGVLGMAQAMAADDLPERQRERLAVIAQSGQSMLHILGDVLDLAKVEAGRLELETLDFDLDDLIAQARGGFTALAESKGLSLNVEIDPTAAGGWRGDPTRLRQILANLISNAVKFTDKGAVTIAAIGHDSGLVLTVSDTGPGVTEEQLSRLFNKFTQADETTTRRYGGTGLGLSICLELAQLMGGAIEARRLMPRGLAFDVSLPLQRARRCADTPEHAPAAATPELRGHWLRVLAAEDHPVNRQVLSLLLGQAGIDPVFAENGAEAVDAWRDGDWDLILMDIQMPVMDGPTAAARIRAEEAETGRPRTPIIALTANVMSHQTEAYQAIGMDRAVGKPIEIQALLAAIQACLADEPDIGRPADVRAQPAT